MVLVIPGNEGRDLADLEIVPRGGEEWVRWGAWLHRPLETVPALPRHATSTATIGPDGHVEWRSVPLGDAPFRVAVAARQPWRAYGPDFTMLQGPGWPGSLKMPAVDCPCTGPASAWRAISGAPGETVEVQLE